VYHCTHHGSQTLLAVAARQLHGSALVIWDHGMLWRERIKAISEVRPSHLFGLPSPPFRSSILRPCLRVDRLQVTIYSLWLRNALVGLTRLSAWVNYENADIVTSCTTVMNPEWCVFFARTALLSPLCASRGAATSVLEPG
jgi:hypothetical protein